MKKLIIFYSYTGNTRKVAKYMAEKIGADIEEIKTDISYSSDYDKVVEDAKAEIREKRTPKIKDIAVNLDNYDTIILGTPVWWYSMAPAMRSFLSQHNLKGKKIYMFATNGGWLGHTFEDMKELLKGSDLQSTLNIPFDEDRQRISNKKINEWLGV